MWSQVDWAWLHDFTQFCLILPSEQSSPSCHFTCRHGLLHVWWQSISCRCKYEIHKKFTSLACLSWGMQTHPFLPHLVHGMLWHWVDLQRGGFAQELLHSKCLCMVWIQGQSCPVYNLCWGDPRVPLGLSFSNFSYTALRHETGEASDLTSTN